ncbi:glycosyltransferase [Synechococcus sp. L2F]|uniref:glycosyltransferase n=1 Tax=Synechococcus sp. L2F TaxID=2823739 RepID=UPI0020CB8B79|nr:glycosyltransferase [Synechococcus sp. L2F]MCP9828518.1 glycosyltransferase [Synechococcus sp. L2F]
MRPLRFLVPGTSGRFRCGGLQVELQTARLTASIVPTEVVTYRRKEPGRPYLADLLRQERAPGSALWIVSWGFDVPRQLRLLRGRAVAYHAHSTGYGFDLPAGVPVLAVSRNTLGYWGNRAPRNPLFLVPNAIDASWGDDDRVADPALVARRPIDVLVQARKSSAYVLQQLVPALRAQGLRVEVQSGWVDDLVGLFRSAKVYLYDSADYWRSEGLSEGFGLPPMEALASGCVVFSSVNHALADFLDPGAVGHQIGFGTLQADLERIIAAAADPGRWQADPAQCNRLLSMFSEQELRYRWAEALKSIDQHWDRLSSRTPPLRNPSPASLEAMRILSKLRSLTSRWRGRSVL